MQLKKHIKRAYYRATPCRKCGAVTHQTGHCETARAEAEKPEEEEE